MTRKKIKTNWGDIDFEDHIGLDLEEKHQKVIERHHESIEELIKKHLPDDFDMKDLEWRPGAMIRGASTLYHKGEPILSLFQAEYRTEESDEGTFKLIAEQKYVSHLDKS